MPEAFTWDLLVHPFFSLNDIFGKLRSFHRPLDSKIRMRLLGDARILNSIWKRRVRFLSSCTVRGLIIIGSAFNQNKLALYGRRGYNNLRELSDIGQSLERDLAGFAHEKLGYERCIIAPVGLGIPHTLECVIRERGLVTGRSTGVVMGEYTDVCVPEAKDVFIALTGQKLRGDRQKGSSSKASMRWAPYRARSQKHLATIKRLAKIRAKQMYKRP